MLFLFPSCTPWKIYSPFVVSRRQIYFSLKTLYCELTNLFSQFSFPQLFIMTVQFSSFVQSCVTLCNPMNCSTPGLPVHHQLPEIILTSFKNTVKLMGWCRQDPYTSKIQQLFSLPYSVYVCVCVCMHKYV